MNDVKKSGDELIAAERERQVLVHGHSIVQDAKRHKGGELVHMVEALIHHKYGYTPDSISEAAINKMMEKSLVERLIYAGALIAAEIDRLNLLKQIDEAMQTPENMQNRILPPSC